MRTTGITLLIGTLLLGGCASVTPPQQSGIDTDYQPGQPVYTPGELNRESLYELMAAEIAGQQRDFDTALDFYLSQVKKSRDPAVAERATRIAQFMRNPDAVLEAATIWSEASPDNPEPDHIRATILISEERFDEALPVLERILDDGSSEAVLILGSKSQELSVESAKRYDELLARYSADEPERLDLLLTRALLKRRAGDDDGALALLDQGLTIEPGQTDLLLQKVDILRTRGQQKAALSLIDQGLDASPEQSQLRVQKAQLLIATDPEAAVALIDDIIAEQPDERQLHYYFALLTLEHEQYAASRRILEQMALQDPHNSNLNFYLGIIDETEGDTESALQHFLSVSSGPNLPQAYSHAVELFDSAEDRAQVAEIIDQGIKRHPGLATRLRLTEANWLQSRGLETEALTLLESALKRDPADVSLLYTYALLIEPQDPQKMLSNLERAIELDPQNGMLQNALGYSLTLYTEDYERAHDLISKALEQHPDDAAVLDSMGWVLFKLGRAQEALNFLQRAYDASEDPEVASHLVEVLWQLDRTEEAQRLLQENLEKSPDDKHLLEIEQQLGVTQ
ncbi:tetratricopeptide repeat protein [Marinobacterium lutimaris]|uniref:Lipopolysaccharide biosynthesis regulator YciM, contains six TPR domains and a predicted metal-binding C-terminal domain n=1 Tax=Marinobacterium lutimaris TaxID=568106 RepID=A0A1H6CSJ9_9GAMM|nr:tetratricopeptide repeat protein [Marinobacterium lutimaris]SEG75982.1 Lipopolysaccharide biosynthesis regulator YciM, contains six TPR domains and a predicted metal-binding C-terminal domain [Marinobacterium lutimaris]